MSGKIFAVPRGTKHRPITRPVPRREAALTNKFIEDTRRIFESWTDREEAIINA